MINKMFFSLAIPLFAAAQAFGATVSSCSQYQGVTVGNYIVQTDYWNMGQCPGTQCMDIDDQTGSFTVTKATYNCVNSIAAYPSILYGKAFGSVSPNCDLPAPLNSLKCVESSWTFTPANTGRWDAAYDIWLCPDNQCGSNGFNGGAEIMIWLDYRNTNGWQHDMGPATIGGRNWEVWWWDVNDSAGKRNYVAYLAKDPTHSVKNLDIKKFLDDAQARGYIQPSWYLYAVLAGVELGSAGTPFTSKSFSVAVNKDCGAQPVYIPVPVTPTPTPDLTPEDIPPPP
jgi:hypothetical protein